MKNFSILLLILSTLALTSCEQSASKKVKGDLSSYAEKAKLGSTTTTSKNAVMSFDKASHDFGVINEGDKVQTKFMFTNTGESDLIIVDARGSCGCTVPEYPKNTPIAPGATGEILVSFDSSNKPGMQQKTVTLSANTDSGREMLRIKATVNPDPVKQKIREEQARARQSINN